MSSRSIDFYLWTLSFYEVCACNFNGSPEHRAGVMALRRRSIFEVPYVIGMSYYWHASKNSTWKISVSSVHLPQSVAAPVKILIHFALLSFHFPHEFLSAQRQRPVVLNTPESASLFVILQCRVSPSWVSESQMFRDGARPWRRPGRSRLSLIGL